MATQRQHRHISFIALLTFPGTMMHEWAHKSMSERLGYRVHDYQLISAYGDGYVRHDKIDSPKDTILVSGAPLYICGTVSLLLWAVVGLLLSFYLPTAAGVAQLPIGVLGAYLAWSTGRAAALAPHDAKKVWQAARRLARHSNRWLVLLAPLSLGIGLSKFRAFSSVIALLPAIPILGGIAAISPAPWYTPFAIIGGALYLAAVLGWDAIVWGLEAIS